MSACRFLGWTLLVSVGFGVGSYPASAQGVPEKKESDWREVADYRNGSKQFPKDKAGLAAVQAVFKSFAQYHVDLINSPALYKTDFRPDPNTPTLDGIIYDLGRNILIPQPTIIEGAQLNKDRADYIREMGAALDAALGKAARESQSQISQVNAARLLAVAAKSGASAHYATITALIKNPNTPLAVKYYALKAAENLLSAYDVYDMGSRKHTGDKAQLLALVQAIEDVIVNPNALVAAPDPGVANPPPTPEDLAVIGYIRRQAVRALGELRFAVLDDLNGGSIYPIHTLARVAMSDPGLSPAPSPTETMEAVIGICNMAPVNRSLYNADAVADVVLSGVITFAGPRAANPVDITAPWRTYAVRLGEAFKYWRPLFDPNYKPPVQNLPQGSAPAAINEVINEITRTVINPLDRVRDNKPDPTVKVNLQTLVDSRDRLRAKPDRNTTIYKDVPNTSIIFPPAKK